MTLSTLNHATAGKPPPCVSYLDKFFRSYRNRGGADVQGENWNASSCRGAIQASDQALSF